MKKASILLGSSTLILLICIAIIGYLISFSEPKITIKAEIKPVTDLDYNRITKRSESFITTAKKDDFKRIDIMIKYSQPKVIISNRKIEFDRLHTALESGNKVVNLSGGYGEQDNPGELTASYTQSAEVYLNGLSVGELMDLFKDHKIKISWYKFGTGNVERIYYLKDFLVVK